MIFPERACELDSRDCATLATFRILIRPTESRASLRYSRNKRSRVRAHNAVIYERPVENNSKESHPRPPRPPSSAVPPLRGQERKRRGAARCGDARADILGAYRSSARGRARAGYGMPYKDTPKR